MAWGSSLLDRLPVTRRRRRAADGDSAIPCTLSASVHLVPHILSVARWCCGRSGVLSLAMWRRLQTSQCCSPVRATTGEPLLPFHARPPAVRAIHAF